MNVARARERYADGPLVVELPMWAKLLLFVPFVVLICLAFWKPFAYAMISSVFLWSAILAWKERVTFTADGIEIISVRGRSFVRWSSVDGLAKKKNSGPTLGELVLYADGKVLAQIPTSQKRVRQELEFLFGPAESNRGLMRVTAVVDTSQT